MLWDIRARMKPALSVIDMIPNIHRTPALAALRRAVFDGRGFGQQLSDLEKQLAFHESSQILTSPVGARILKSLYDGGQLKLKKPGRAKLSALEAYIATEADFRAAVDRILAEDAARQQRLTEILADPAQARPDEITPQLIDRLATAQLGHGVAGRVEIAGLICHRDYLRDAAPEHAGLRAEDRRVCWWIDPAGQRQGDPA